MFALPLAWLLRILAASWRVEGIETVHSEMAKWERTPLLLGCWHGKYIPLLLVLRGMRAQVFVGEGKRGRILERISRGFGYTPLLLPHGNRDRSVELMQKALAGPIPCAVCLDGPLGPARRVKSSLIRLSSAQDATILPISVSAKPSLVLRRRWDHREIPLPFARVQIRVGKSITIPRELSKQRRHKWSKAVKAAVDALDVTPKGENHAPTLSPLPESSGRLGRRVGHRR